MMVNVNTDKLKSERVAMGISRSKLSLLSGLPSNAVFRMETKEMKVNILRLKEVAKALKCNVNDLIKEDI